MKVQNLTGRNIDNNTQNRANRTKNSSYISQKNNCDTVQFSGKFKNPTRVKAGIFAAFLSLSAIFSGGSAKTPETELKNNNIYVVEEGDSLSSITRQYVGGEDASWSEIEPYIAQLAEDNDLKTENINPGTKLDISCLTTESHELSELNETEENKYIVQNGDSLSSIVRHYIGEDKEWTEIEPYISKLAEDNGIDKDSSLQPQTELDISGLKNIEEADVTKTSEPEKSVDEPTKEETTTEKATTEQSNSNTSESSNGIVNFESYEPNSEKDMTVANVQKFYSTLPEGEGELSGKTIMINAGHGGVKPGSKYFDIGASNEEQKEYELSAEYAENLAQKLVDKGADVVMTQGSVFTLSSPIEQFAEDNSDNIDDTAFVSIHFDAFEDPSIKGASVYYQPEKDSSFADELYSSLEENGINFLHKEPQQKNLLVTRTATSEDCGIDKAVLVECGTLSNSDDAKLVKEEEYKENLTDSIVDGIIKSYSD